jgi:hypothetical protein
MKEERIQKLNEIGFEWFVPPVDSWDKRFEELKAFQREHGHCRVPGVNDKDSATYKLASWVSKQRQRYKLLQQGKKGFVLTEERIQKLNEIGFEWSVTKVFWDERFKDLKAFEKEHGHWRVPGKYDKNSATHQLALWVSKQRQGYKLLQQGKKGFITEERIQKLNGIGLEWSL